MDPRVHETGAPMSMAGVPVSMICTPHHAPRPLNSTDTTSTAMPWFSFPPSAGGIDWQQSHCVPQSHGQATFAMYQPPNTVVPYREHQGSHLPVVTIPYYPVQEMPQQRKNRKRNSPGKKVSGITSENSVVLNSIIPPHAGTNAGYVYDPFQACQMPAPSSSSSIHFEAPSVSMPMMSDPLVPTSDASSDTNNLPNLPIDDVLNELFTTNNSVCCPSTSGRQLPLSTADTTPLQHGSHEQQFQQALPQASSGLAQSSQQPSLQIQTPNHQDARSISQELPKLSHPVISQLLQEHTFDEQIQQSGTGSSKKRSSYDRSDDPMSGVSSPKKTKSQNLTGENMIMLNSEELLRRFKIMVEEAVEESVKKSQKELMINLREESRDEFKVICKQLENERRDKAVVEYQNKFMMDELEVVRKQLEDERRDKAVREYQNKLMMDILKETRDVVRKLENERIDKAVMVLLKETRDELKVIRKKLERSDLEDASCHQYGYPVEKIKKEFEVDTLQGCSVKRESVKTESYWALPQASSGLAHSSQQPSLQIQTPNHQPQMQGKILSHDQVPIGQPMIDDTCNQHKLSVANKDGRTPLFTASGNGHEAVVKSLLSKGANVDLPSEALPQASSGLAHSSQQPSLQIQTPTPNHQAHETCLSREHPRTLNTCVQKGKATLLAAIEKKNDPCKAALTLMDELFTVEEMSKSCFKAGSDRAHSTKKPPLDEKGVQLIYECLHEKFNDVNEDKVVESCNQKCRDAKKKLKS